MKKIRVMIADDHAILRMGLSSLLGRNIAASEKADIHSRIGAGQSKKLLIEKRITRKGEAMGLRAKEAGHGEAYLFIPRMDHGELAFAAGAFQAEHIRSQ